MDVSKLRQLIDSRGLKHKKLAARIDMHPSVFCRALKGEKKFDQEKLELLLKILDLKFEALLQKAS